jgi:hypothetical protein
MNDRIITNATEVTDFLDDIMQQEDIEPGRGLVEEKWIQTVLRKYIQNDYPNGTITKKSSDNVYFKVSLTKKFRKQIITIIYYFDSLISEDKNNKEKILKLSFDVALKKAEEWSKVEEEETFIKNKEYKEQYNEQYKLDKLQEKVNKKQERKELLSLKDLEQTFNSLKGSKEDPRVLTKWCENLWKVLNKKLFGNKFKRIRIVMTDTLKDHSWLASYDNYGNIKITPKLFNTSFSKLKMIMTHEMCHQAVNDISKISVKDPEYGEEVGGHGSEWIKWMEICKIKPNRFEHTLFENTYDYSEFLTTDRNLEQEALNKGQKPFNRQLKKYELVKFTSGGWKIGMAVANYTYKKGKICTIVYKDEVRYTRSNYDYSDLWKVTPKDLENIDIPAMKKLVDEYLEKV